MARPKKERTIKSTPVCTFFEPSTGKKSPTLLKKKVTSGNLIQLGHDELEAIRLIDVEGLSMKEGAKKMNISAPTLCRIVSSGREKMATAITTGVALMICENE